METLLIYSATVLIVCIILALIKTAWWLITLIHEDPSDLIMWLATTAYISAGLACTAGIYLEYLKG